MARIPLDAPPRILRPGDRGWPAGFADLPSPPRAIELAGSLPDLAGAVAIVGTRHADLEALEFTRLLAGELAVAGRMIVSGGAHGIDAAAHEGALGAGGATIAVLATGLVRAYPARHAPLFARIARSGALVCESSSQSRGGAWIFLRRNRLVAAAVSTVVVVQAPLRSGALSTAAWAKRLKRRLMVVPAAPTDPRGTGCLELLRGGADICTSAADVLSLAPSASTKPATRLANRGEKWNDDAGLSPQVRAVWEHLSKCRGHPDQIALALDMPANEVQEALLSLLLTGLCRRRGDGSYATSVTSPKGDATT